MKTLILSLALLAFTFISCDNSQAPTASQNTGISKATVEKDIPLDFGCFEVCGDGESGCCVCLTGTAQIVTSGNGKTAHVKYHLTGEGYDCATGEPNGVKYTGSLTQSINNVDNGFPANASITINSNGKGCNFQEHVTINANGEVTATNTGCE